jgi:hypothetical protein
MQKERAFLFVLVDLALVFGSWQRCFVTISTIPLSIRPRNVDICQGSSFHPLNNPDGMMYKGTFVGTPCGFHPEFSATNHVWKLLLALPPMTRHMDWLLNNIADISERWQRKW